MNNRAEENTERFRLIGHKEKCLLVKESLSSQHFAAMEKAIQAREKKDHAALQRALDEMIDIATELKFLNMEISNIDNRLTDLPEG